MRCVLRLVASVVLSAAVVSACTAGESADDAAARASARNDSAVPSTSPDTTSQPVEGGARPDASAGMPILAGVGIVSEEGSGFESLVFAFRDGPLPRYRVEYVTPPLSDCGQGNPVPIAGAALLHVRFEPTDAHAEVNGQMQATVAREIPVSAEVVEQLTRICDFEGVVEWGVGVKGRVPFRVRIFDTPPRVTVDLWRGAR